MTEHIIFGDIEEALITFLRTETAAHGRSPTVGNALPTDRTAEMVVVQRAGGPKRDLVTDSALVTFECWGSTRATAASLGGLVRGFVNSLPGQTISGLTVYQVQEAGFTGLPFTLTTSPRYLLTARVEYRGAAL